LDERQRRVLFALCREYVLTGRPVSSLSLARRHQLEWSSATIRAELAQLEQMGYLRQPHKAAGRFPTRLGLSSYLESVVVASEPRPEHRRAVDLTVAPGAAQASMRGAARVLSELAGCVGIGFLGTEHAGVLTKVELVGLGGAHALIVMEMHDQSRCVRRVELAAPPEGRALSRLEDHLRALLLGQTLDDARARLSELMAEHEARVDAWLGEAVRLGFLLCNSRYLDPLLMQVVGQATLAGARGLADDLPRVLELLEDYNRLADVLYQLIPSDDGKVHVQLEVPLDGARTQRSGLTLVGCRVGVGGPPTTGPQTGAVAVLGPDSMDFEAVIPLVEYAAKALANRA
jgi:heat-inducible transcriptional repressor